MDDADNPSPPTQPGAFLVPPTKITRTALAVATPPPPPPSRRAQRTPRGRMNVAQFFATLIFDSVDDVADAVADSLGLRRR
jgi:hypothetical protein